jgi:hypothetical protein
VLDAPRALLAWVLALLDDPPKALVFRDDALLPAETCRLPILFPPPLLVPRFAPPILFPPPPLVPRFAPVLLGRVPAFEPPVEPGRFAPVAARLPALGC